MQQLSAAWAKLDPRRRIIVAAASIAMFASVLALSQMAATPKMALLYSGLDAAAAGDVVRSLEQRGVAHDIRGNSIFVDRAQRDALRMTLASEGLPANGAAGYELLDSLSGFGTTSQMFDAAYWRAKEGELARTIVASPQIKSARVHIATPGTQRFNRDLMSTASVTVVAATGSIDPAQAKALRYLVASSVAGMKAEDVAVIDGATGTVVTADETTDGHPFAQDRAERLRQNVMRLLEARMGPGKAVVEVSLETVTERETIMERQFDPDSRVAISTETEETTASTRDNRAGGDVTVASNLPTGEGAADENSSSNDNRTRERVNYEVSETQREIQRLPGAIKRLSVAVLLEGQRRIDETGTEVWEPLPEAQLQAMRDLVASAVGFSAERGDVITLKSMPFDQAAPAGTLAEPGLIEAMGLDIMSLVQIAVLAIVGLVLGLFVLRPILVNTPEPARAALPPAAPVPERQEALVGEITDGTTPMAANDVTPAGNLPALPAAQPDPVARLRKLIEERQTESVEILRSWVEDEGETA